MPRVLLEDVAAVVRSLPNNKAPGISSVPNSVLKMMGEPLIMALRVLTQAYLDQEQYPAVFKVARVVALKKPGKSDYQAVKAQRLIALLETVRKVIEAIIARYLRDIAEANNLLLEQQIGVRRGRSTDTALALLLGQIRIAWENPGAVATVLFLNVSRAFDRVLRERLMHKIRRRRVPRSICGWVNSFMSDWRTTLAFNDQELEAFSLPRGIPQGSPLSPILFLFYNAELLKRYERRDLRVLLVGFIDDINLIAYGDLIEDNY